MTSEEKAIAAWNRRASPHVTVSLHQGTTFESGASEYTLRRMASQTTRELEAALADELAKIARLRALIAQDVEDEK
jgi:hypothetical protein